ncbi:MAG: hypothetical protein Q8M92_01280 [Candidatus Subteraquimicrobiales bacterium]|nr:hypothetical protein [Candidatus Subteraquimicrobiales bacterium]
MFIIKNIKTGETNELSSQQFKEKIIALTRSRFENSSVLSERTGLRPESLNALLAELNTLIIQKNVFIVTALSRINNDKHSRYLILIDSDKYDDRIADLVFDYIPIYSVKIKDELREEGVLSKLSGWFRATMGRGFSFIDIDYLIIDRDFNKAVLFEEKIGKSGVSSIGYGQLLSYKELISDVIKKQNSLFFVFSIEKANIGDTVSYFKCDKNSFSGNNLINSRTEQKTLRVLSQEIITLLQ